MLSPRLPAFLSALTTAAMLVAGTGCRDHQEKARAELQAASCSFTVGDFLKASAAGRCAIATFFLDAGMNPNVALPDGTTALFTAAAQGQGEMVKLLLSRGANAAMTGPQGIPPLLAAVRSGDERSVSALLKAGADPTLKSPEGETCLAAAALLGHAVLVEMLAPVCHEPTDPALRLACSKGHTAVMDVLLNAGADINSKDDQQRTPLMLAAMAGQLSAVKLLCHRQALTSCPDAGQRNAAELAAAAGQEDTASFLREWAVRHPDDSPASPAPFSAPVLASGSTAAGLVSGTAKADSGNSSTAGPAMVNSPPSGARNGTVETSLSTPVSPAAPPPSRPLTSARFPRLHCDAVDDVPGLLRMTSYQLRPWPFLLKDVDPGHEAADLELTLEDHKIVSLRLGATIPGTDCVIEKLRRRRVYSEGKDQKLVNASEMTFRQNRSGEVFRATPATVVLSSDSSALVSIAGVETVWTATAGDEFRLGTSLLKVITIEPKSLTIENRLTRETVKVPLQPPG